MESINNLFMITAGVLAVVGTVLFIAGIILKTPLKYVFLMIAVLGFVGRFLLPFKVYHQAKEEGIVWLTVLNGGDLDKARSQHQQGIEATEKFLSFDTSSSPQKNAQVFIGDETPSDNYDREAGQN